MNSEYIYDGPVFYFDDCLKGRWKASTYATSKQKALNNLSYRYKSLNGMAKNAKIILPGKIQKKENA